MIGAHSPAVISDLTGCYSPCTMAPGLLIDGVRIGAIADVDVFDMFTLDLTEAKVDGKHVLSEAQRKYLLRHGMSDMWNVNYKTAKVKPFKRNADNKQARLDRLTAFYQNQENLDNELSPFSDDVN